MKIIIKNHRIYSKKLTHYDFNAMKERFMFEIQIQFKKNYVIRNEFDFFKTTFIRWRVNFLK